MSMKDTITRLDMVARMELEEANKNHPGFSSYHEGYAVIREETEELEESVAPVKEVLELLWQVVRKDEAATDKLLDELYENALYAAGEAVQVAAMAMKFKTTLEVEEWDYADQKSI